MVQYVQRRVCVCVNVSQLRLFNANNYNRYNMGVAWQGSEYTSAFLFFTR